MFIHTHGLVVSKSAEEAAGSVKGFFPCHPSNLIYPTTPGRSSGPPRFQRRRRRRQRRRRQWQLRACTKCAHTVFKGRYQGCAERQSTSSLTLHPPHHKPSGHFNPQSPSAPKSTTAVQRVTTRGCARPARAEERRAYFINERPSTGIRIRVRACACVFTAKKNIYIVDDPTAMKIGRRTGPAVTGPRTRAGRDL